MKVLLKVFCLLVVLVSGIALVEFGLEPGRAQAKYMSTPTAIVFGFALLSQSLLERDQK